MHHIPFVLNILILLPVVIGMLTAPNGTPVAAFGGIADAPSLRVMVASLWTGVLVMSAVALINPLAFWPLLAFQFVYKAIFLASFCLPIWLGRAEGVIPHGPVTVFIGIVLIWPFFIVLSLRAVQV